VAAQFSIGRLMESCAVQKFNVVQVFIIHATIELSNFMIRRLFFFFF